MIQLRKWLGAGLICLALPLASCQNSQDAPATDDAGSLAGPEAKPGMTVGGGKLVLPIVAGRPGVAYFKLNNGADKAVGLASVHIDGAEKAEVHKTQGNSMAAMPQLEIPAKETVRFARGGLHVMVFGISDSLAAGGKTEMTLTFSDGDKLSAPLEIEAMQAETEGQ